MVRIPLQLSSRRMEIKKLKINSGWVQELGGMVLIFLIALNVFSPMFFSGKAIFHRDFHFITYPFRYLLGQAYQQGLLLRLPAWVVQRERLSTRGTNFILCPT